MAKYKIKFDSEGRSAALTIAKDVRDEMMRQDLQQIVDDADIDYWHPEDQFHHYAYALAALVIMENGEYEVDKGEMGAMAAKVLLGYFGVPE